MAFETYRDQFPVVERMLFLNHASEAPVSRPVRVQVESYLDVAMGDPDAAPMSIGRCKELLAQLLGGTPAEYAAMPNTGTAIGIVANGLDWRPGDNVVVPDEEYPANVLPWLALSRLGVEIRRVPLRDLRVDLADVERLVDSRTRVVAVSAVEFLSGYRNDLKALGEIAHRHGALFVVDAIQQAGAFRLNVDEAGIDVLAAGGYKWLLGPIGTGFAYFRRSCWEQVRPVLPGARSLAVGPAGWTGMAEDAQRYETGCLPFSLYHGWTAGLEMLLEAGVDKIERHLLDLTDRAVAGLRARGLTVLSPVAHEGERSGIVVFSKGTPEENDALVKRLYSQGIVIALRLGRCRVSPHFYNTAADIDRFLEAL
ncbi:MAG: aminotransferase class V-fold PLP-dependent enzyme [Symbiobacteriaceae bacterium]|jgi:selenocysteine lyase/cysteine desulfurase|nr:aminotransferase class V-fold PLP-dependent enzyme [Symbiobacteriaceae bacterium]